MTSPRRAGRRVSPASLLLFLLRGPRKQCGALLHDCGYWSVALTRSSVARSGRIFPIVVEARVAPSSPSAPAALSARAEGVERAAARIKTPAPACAPAPRNTIPTLPTSSAGLFSPLAVCCCSCAPSICLVVCVCPCCVQDDNQCYLVDSCGLISGWGCPRLKLYDEGKKCGPRRVRTQLRAAPPRGAKELSSTFALSACLRTVLTLAGCAQCRMDLIFCGCMTCGEYEKVADALAAPMGAPPTVEMDR